MPGKILEISKRATTNGGRVPIKIALLKIHDDENETNKNGLHWKEEYVLNALESIKFMPICASFCDDDKTIPLDHGLTGKGMDENGNEEPLFENSETVGCIANGSIESLNIDGEDVKVLCGKGYLYNQRYPKFVSWVRTNNALGNVDTSIEIMGLETNNNNIIYEENEPTSEYRTPKEFQFSGTCILSVEPADDNAIVMEVAQKEKQQKEEKNNMEFDVNELKTFIQDTIAESNSKNEELTAQITELNSQLVEKDEKISELNATVEQVQKALDDLNKEHETYWAEREALEKELGELKAKERLGELSSALSKYSEDEQKYAESEINAFKENPLEGNLDAIKSKICIEIVAKQKEDAKNSEQNSKNTSDDVEDIFSEMCEEKSDDEDVNIF